MFEKTDLAVDYGPLGAVNYTVSFDESTGEFDEIVGRTLYPPKDPILKDIFQEITDYLDPEAIAASMSYEVNISIVLDYSLSGERLALFVDALRKKGLFSEVVKAALLMAIVEGLDYEDGSLLLPTIKQAFLKRVEAFERFEEYKKLAELYLF